MPAQAKRYSDRVLYASRSGCRLDSDRSTGGGTDDAVAIQAAIDDLEAGGGGTFVLDGDALIGTPIRLPSRVTFDGLGMTGSLYLKADIAGPALRNDNWISSYNGGSPVYDGSTIQDTDITVRGVYVNGNRPNASDHATDPRINAAQMVMAGLQFHGVQRLRLENIEIYDTTFGIHGSNLFDSTIRNVRHVDPVADAGTPVVDRLTVTMQLIGPLDRLEIENVKGTVSDDTIGLCADDVNTAPGGTWNLGLGTTINPASAFYGGNAACYRGPITNVTVRGLYPERCLSALRLHSGHSTAHMDNVTVADVKGSCSLHAFVANQFLGLAGDYRRVTLREWAVDLMSGAGSSDGYMLIGGTWKQLRILDHARTDLHGTDNSINFNTDSVVDQLVVSLDVDETNTSNTSPLIDISGGTFRHVHIERADWWRPDLAAVVNTSILRHQAGTLEHLTVCSAMAHRVARLLDLAGGVVSNVSVGSVVHNAGIGTPHGSVRVTDITVNRLMIGAYVPEDDAYLLELVGAGAVAALGGGAFQTLTLKWTLGSGTPVVVGASPPSGKQAIPFAGRIVKAHVVADTGPTGADLILDINYATDPGGPYTSIWATNQANRLKVVAGAQAGEQADFDTVAVAADSYVDLDVDQVGSGTAGQDVVVTLTILMLVP